MCIFNQLGHNLIDANKRQTPPFPCDYVTLGRALPATNERLLPCQCLDGENYELGVIIVRHGLLAARLVDY